MLLNLYRPIEYIETISATFNTFDVHFGNNQIVIISLKGDKISSKIVCIILGFDAR